MKTFDSYLKQKLEDADVRREYEAMEPEFAIVQAMIDARKASGLTQKELSDKTGITQADISRLERGNANPSLQTLRRLAAGMGMRVNIEFVKVTQEDTQCEVVTS